MSFDISKTIQQAEQLLRNVLSLALKKRLPPTASIATLRALATTSGGATARRTRDVIYVTGQACVYQWAQFSTLPDDGDLVVKPDDVAGSGRWLKQASTVLLNGVAISKLQDGVIKQVVLHNGDFSEETLRAKIYGRAPCIAIHFAGADNELKSQIPGALYDQNLSFEIWSVSRNFRDDEEGAIGPELAAEIADDPGVFAIHGLVKKLLADNATGEQIGESGVRMIAFGAERPEYSDLAGRVFVMALEIDMMISVHNPDAPAELVQPTEIDVQRMRAQASAARVYDESNAVTSGLEVSPGIGYVKTISAGGAVIGGTPVTALSALHTFGVDVDTYRDLKPDGTWVFFEVPHGHAVSDPSAGNLRVAITVTDATGVAADRFLCTFFTPDGDPDVIPLT